MATDIHAVNNNLMSFYDFFNKRVLHVGAGGGQLLGYSTLARSVIGIDSNKEATAQLKRAVEKMQQQDSFTVVHGDFLSMSSKVDVVFFEFCFHEMSHQNRVLIHAHSLAPEILVLDHLPDSPWAWYTCETEKVKRSWNVLRTKNIVRTTSFKAIQRFDDHSQLHEKVRVQGESAIDRASNHIGQYNIEIEMTYAAALLERGMV